MRPTPSANRCTEEVYGFQKNSTFSLLLQSERYRYRALEGTRKRERAHVRSHGNVEVHLWVGFVGKQVFIVAAFACINGVLMQAVPRLW